MLIIEYWGWTTTSLGARQMRSTEKNNHLTGLMRSTEKKLIYQGPEYPVSARKNNGWH